MSDLKVAAVQMACRPEPAANLDKAETLLRRAAAAGAQLVLLQELFETPYFCIEQVADRFALAREARDNPMLDRFAALARELSLVLPVSFFERAGPRFFNTVMVFDADGRALGLYRKAHIPQNPGYEEKYYFTPGDTGFRVWDTACGRIGVGICWDQWFPEAARLLVLQGAELLLYPTAIGSEPADPAYDSRDHWRRTIQGHAAANIVPVMVANRVGREVGTRCAVTFYGSSFITDAVGACIAEADRESESIVTASLDLAAARRLRESWGVFRDRRPDLYGGLMGRDAQFPYARFPYARFPYARFPYARFPYD